MERGHLEDPDVSEKIILKFTFKKWHGETWTGGYGSGQEQVAGNYECGNEHSSYIKCGKILD